MITISITKKLEFAAGKKDLSFTTHLQEKTITALYGESGAGKTTLLKIMAGLIKPESGKIEVNNEVWFDEKNKINIPPQQRSIGFVFQDYALFPNMTVLQNLHYAAGKNREKHFINSLVEIASLQSFLQTKPTQLSGGQQQRVALIRALVRKPKLLLLDEPLAALDVTMRHNLHLVLQQLQQELQFTAVLVSHDIGEVYTLAKHVIRLQDGDIIFEGSPQQLFNAPGLSSKLQVTAEIINIIPNGAVCIVEVLAMNNIIKITATAEEISAINIGDNVLIYTKAFSIGLKKMR